ncbi:MAG: hypothetical protein QM765_08630 [Myxococcales bacterium]
MGTHARHSPFSASHSLGLPVAWSIGHSLSSQVSPFSLHICTRVVVPALQREAPLVQTAQ